MEENNVRENELKENIVKETETKENKVKEFLKYNKKGILIGLLVFTIIFVAIILVLVFSNNSKKEEQQKEEDKLNGYLNELGKSFYEDYYYDAVESKNEDAKREFLLKFSEIGIKVNLDNLSRYNGDGVEEKVKEFKNEAKNEDCNDKDTKVIIYPKEPYGKTDYEIEAVLECGFDE